MPGEKGPIWLMLFFNKQLMAGAWQLMIINGVFIGIRKYTELNKSLVCPWLAAVGWGHWLSGCR